MTELTALKTAWGMLYIIPQPDFNALEKSQGLSHSSLENAPRFPHAAPSRAETNYIEMKKLRVVAALREALDSPSDRTLP